MANNLGASGGLVQSPADWRHRVSPSGQQAWRVASSSRAAAVCSRARRSQRQRYSDAQAASRHECGECRRQKGGAESKRHDFHAQERCCMQHGGKTRHVRKEHTASCVTSVWMSKLQSRGQRNATAFFREQSMAAEVGLCRKEPACACFWLTT